MAKGEGEGDAEEVRVPGAVITIDPYHGRNRVFAWLWIAVRLPVHGVNWKPLESRDVVIFDDRGKAALFREGPYSSRVATSRMAEVVAQVKAVGIKEFLRKEQVAEGKIGPISVNVPTTSPAKFVIDSIRRRFK